MKYSTKLANQVHEFHEACAIASRDTPGVPSDDQVRYRLRLIVEEVFEAIEACWVPPTDKLPYTAGHLNKTVQHIIANTPIAVDLPSFIDALTDINYVVEAAAQAFGVDMGPITDEVQRANMAKLAPCECSSRIETTVGPGPTSPVLTDFGVFSHCPPDSDCQRCGGRGRICKKDSGGKVIKPDGWTPPDIVGKLREQGWRPESERGPRQAVSAEIELEALKRLVRDAEASGFSADARMVLISAVGPR